MKISTREILGSVALSIVAVAGLAIAFFMMFLLLVEAEKEDERKASIAYYNLAVKKSKRLRASEEATRQLDRDRDILLVRLRMVKAEESRRVRTQHIVLERE